MTPQAILSGDLPKADYPLFTRQRWIDEAQAAIDTGDDAELREMIERQDAFDSQHHAAAMRAYYDVDPRRRNWMEELV